MMSKTAVTSKRLGTWGLILLLAGCVGVPKPDERNFRDPSIGLDHVEVSYYTGYYYFSNTITPTRGKADNYGAPLLLAFIYQVRNPNPYPILLERFSFGVMFDAFKVNHVILPEAIWIPSEKTSMLRAPAMFDARQTLLALLLPGAMKLRDKSVAPWDLLEKWWTGAQDFAFPIAVTEGAAVFRAGDVTRAVPFEATFPAD
jgi:hypothetical protein